jgi:signal transduction histidine kinase
MRPWPRNLLGQTLLAVALALLAAQAVSAVLLYRAAENRQEAAVLNAAAISLLVDPGPGGSRRDIARRLRRSSGGPMLARPLRGELTAANPLLGGETSDARLADSLEQLLAGQGVEPAALLVTLRRAGDDPVLRQRAQSGRRFAFEPGWANRRILVAAVRRDAAGPWQVARVVVPPREARVIGGIVLQTLVLVLVLTGVLYLLLRRITRPLAALTARTERFARTQDASGPLVPSGPDDIRRLQAAHNAMEQRIAALLDEKDVMLGAIGHDLKTPLTALRVRIESVESESQRAKMAAGIEDITRSLDDILSLARIGQAKDAPEPAQIGALAEAVVEEFEDMGEKVSFTGAERIVLAVQVTWLRRALRNPISNALRYGGNANVSLLRENGMVVLRVEDSGPGIPDDQIARMLEPFQRGEASRNRATGGAGLGLTLARAIAEQHGGQLVLANRAEVGLRAELRLPA